MPISAIRRWRIRRLYNAGEWKSAHELAERELGSKNHDFACNLILRALYNEKEWESLVEFSKCYPTNDLPYYSDKAKRKIIELREAAKRNPQPNQTFHWSEKELLSNWSQEDTRLWLRHPWGWVYWDMPDGFLLSETHPALLHLALEVLLSPWIPATKLWNIEKRTPGRNHSLSYSGGVDSTAAMLLMPEETILAYHERNFTSMINHSLPHSTFAAIKDRTSREVLCIPSNHEKIRTYHGKQTGFSTDHAAGVHLILLSDFLDLRGIAFGTPIDNTWLKKGLLYRDFSKSDYWLYWSKRFNDAGLSYDLTINHISEGGTLEICRQSVFHDVVNSCLRGTGFRWCGKCWKCFHKNGPLGRSFDAGSKEILTFLNKSPLRTGFHVLWATKQQGLEKLAPHLTPYLDEDFSWWIKAYPPGLDLINHSLNSPIIRNTEIYLDWMNPPFQLESTQIDI